MVSLPGKLPTPRRRHFLLRRRRGWIGVDVGAALTKLAQVERTGGAYRMTARWCLPASASSQLLQDLHEAGGESDITQQLRHGRRAFRGKRAAAALSASVTTHRHIDLPGGHAEELRQMVCEEIEAEAAPGTNGRCFDFWQTANTASPSDTVVQLSVADMDRTVSLKLAGNLRQAGMDCRVLDAVPCALARAVDMFAPDQSEVPKAILDVGHSSTVFVAVVRGTPAFTRVLRGCGLDTIIRPIQDSLQLTADESLRLVRRIGLVPGGADTRPDAAAQVIHQLISEPVAKLLAETTRTLGYLQQGLAALVPEQIVLAGGGTSLPHLATCIESETGLQVVPWTLSAQSPDAASRDESLFAVAAALSALAWET